MKCVRSWAAKAREASPCRLSHGKVPSSAQHARAPPLSFPSVWHYHHDRKQPHTFWLARWLPVGVAVEEELAAGRSFAASSSCPRAGRGPYLCTKINDKTLSIKAKS